MANFIEYTAIPAKTFVTPTSRYADSRVIYYTENRYLTFETYKRKQQAESGSDMFMIVPKSKEYRPDLVSRDAYGTVDFWWKILEANGLADVYDFKAGTNVRLPKNIFI